MCVCECVSVVKQRTLSQNQTTHLATDDDDSDFAVALIKTYAQFY